MSKTRRKQEPWAQAHPKKLTKGLRRQIARLQRQNEAEAQNQRSAIGG